MKNNKMEALVAAAVITASSISNSVAGYILPKPLLFGGVYNCNSITDMGTRTFKPRRHVCFEKFNNLTPGSNIQGRIEAPEGYVVYNIETHLQKDEKTDKTRAYAIVYYINTKTVQASLAFNELTRSFDYCTPGRIVKKETNLTRQQIRR